MMKGYSPVKNIVTLKHQTLKQAQNKLEYSGEGD